MRLLLIFSAVMAAIEAASVTSSASASASDQTGTSWWTQNGADEIEEALKCKQQTGVAKNVILFVGDGMGVNTRTAARIYKGGETHYFNFERFPDTALLKTYAVDTTVPDSACTATALFSGVKTNYNVVGVSANVSVADCTASLSEANRLENVIHWAQQAGKHTGLVTTTRVTHATPSALYSYSADRKWECEATMPGTASLCKDIARQLVEDEPGRNINVIMGGGRQCLTWNITDTPTDPLDTWGCYRKDGRNLIEAWRQDKQQRSLNHIVLERVQELKSMDTSKDQFVLGIFANGHIGFSDQRDPKMPSLADMTTAAIKVLQNNPNGFFLMVEGGMIDQAHHRGYARRALEETVELDDAVSAAMLLTDPEDTLLVLTSDHAHSLNINGPTSSRSNILDIASSSKVDGLPYTTLTYAVGGSNNYQYQVVNGNAARVDPTLSDTKAFNYSQQTGILQDEAKHGGGDVAVFAKGPWSHLFQRVHEQTYVAYVIQYAARMGKYQHRPLVSAAVTTSATALIALHLPLFTCLLYINRIEFSFLK